MHAEAANNLKKASIPLLSGIGAADYQLSNTYLVWVVWVSLEP